MKRILSILALLFVIIAPGKAVGASDSLDKLLEDISNQTQIEILDEYIKESIIFETTGYSTAGELIKAIAMGEYSINIKELISLLGKELKASLSSGISLTISVTCVCVLYGLVANVFSDNLGGTVKKASMCAVYVTVVAMLVTTYTGAVDCAVSGITKLASFMQAFVPLLIFMLAVSGGTLTAGLMSPALMFFTGSIMSVITQFLIPASRIGFGLTLADKLIDSVRFSHFGNFIKKGCYFILGGMFTLFGSLVTMESFAFAASDTAAAKALKFALKDGIPVIGGFLSDSADTIAGFIGVIKNSLGFVGVMIIFLIVLSPILKTAGIYLALKLCVIISQPFAESRIVDAVDESASFVFFMMVCSVSVAVMFIILTALLIFLGNYILAMR